MCNHLHKVHQEIPAEGEGWKIFYSSDLSFKEDRTLIWNHFYKVGKDGWIRYCLDVDDGPKETQGFCFFLTEEYAKKVMDTWLKNRKWEIPFIYIKKIRYEKGLGVHTEIKMMHKKRIRTAVCKMFKIID